MNINTLLAPNTDLSIFQPYTIDCGKCCGLCCVALYFSKMEGFPENKDPGIPCKNLRGDYRCSIHSVLSDRGLKGCMAYDCFGAGQHITSLMPSPPDWNSISPDDADRIFKSYLTVMQLHQILWYLTEASSLCLKGPEKDQAGSLLIEGTRLSGQPLEILQDLDLTPFRRKANKLLKTVYRTLKASLFPYDKQNSAVKMDALKNCMGKNLSRKNLRGADFSMALMIAADLEQADMFGASLLGADLRDANVRNTDLSQCLFLTQIQINAANGNRKTKLPPYLRQPEAWG